MTLESLSPPKSIDYDVSSQSLYMDTPGNKTRANLLVNLPGTSSCTNSHGGEEQEERRSNIPQNLFAEESYQPLNKERSESSLSLASAATVSSCGSTKSVSFSNVRVREHCVIIGDNPCCECLPISLGWGHTGEKIYDIDDYEDTKQMRRRPVGLNSGVQRSRLSQRHHIDLADKLSYEERRKLLTRLSGLSESDIMWLEWQRRSDENRYVLS